MWIFVDNKWNYCDVLILYLCYVVGLWGIFRCGLDIGEKVIEDCELWIRIKDEVRRNGRIIC